MSKEIITLDRIDVTFQQKKRQIQAVKDVSIRLSLIHIQMCIRDSKWANIVAKKTAKDGANSKVYAKFGVEIYVAAKKGDPDPETNTALKFVIDRAKQAQVPKHVIDKAIDKAKGNTDETFTEGRYEGFGPNGSMLIVDTLTSNEMCIRDRFPPAPL